MSAGPPPHAAPPEEATSTRPKKRRWGRDRAYSVEEQLDLELESARKGTWKTATPANKAAAAAEAKEASTRREGLCSRKLCCCCTVRRCLTSCFVCLLVLVLGLTGLLLVGAAEEAKAVEAADSTAWIYGTDSVCSWQRATYPNVSAARAANESVMHCGDCGACSNGADMKVYEETRNTLTKTATQCAMLSFFGDAPVRSCLLDAVGFTADCNECWVENVMCDQESCKWTCLHAMITGQRNNLADGELNPCLNCDEKLCGPAFIDCVGVNRRRAGIRTDIGRDEGEELCSTAQPPP